MAAAARAELPGPPIASLPDMGLMAVRKDHPIPPQVNVYSVRLDPVHGARFYRCGIKLIGL